MKKPKVLILRTAGTNCDRETAFAFNAAGAAPDFVHVNELISKKKKLNDYHILAIPGGFTYGDDIASGKILANELRFKLAEEVDEFVKSGKLIIGICNGFQVLVKAGLLPGITGRKIQATLTRNDSGKFQDQWVYLKRTENREQRTDRCVWTQGLPQIIYLPVAHGEGKFIPKDESVRQNLWNNGQIVLQYEGYNPNGSVDNIAGICDPTGRIFGLMPHPERHAFAEQHPRWTAAKPSAAREKKRGDGFQIFKNAIQYAEKNLP